MPPSFSNSFKSCGLNHNTSGSAYGCLFHCFKEGEPCQRGREQLISQLNVDEADNAVFSIEEDDEISDVDI